MDEIQSIRNNIIDHQPEAWPAIEKSAGNGGNPTLSKLVDDFDRLDKVLHRILETGAQVKDINTGLLDFPALREGTKCICAGSMARVRSHSGMRSKPVLQAASR